ncbi:hypothetical protein GCM10011331_13220 [Flavimobilis marinus]|uniref:MotA/TolQ/ExbB proton channel family protein n=1 Tax=Flavimobilis marinus TaxID=285351 RepID=A0A1I2G1H7_9MICO|nr:hypothetical protein GCM10011331_13220 [Flavimobilis marinus]SFF10989.1 hypothetical protein SAMN04488035_1646 [Flavimobilis marinus]
MDDGSLGGVWELLLPRFGEITGGTVEALTPILVLIIWVAAGCAIGFASVQYHRGVGAIREIKSLVDGRRVEDLLAHRNEVLQEASTKSDVAANAWREFDETLVLEGGRLYNTLAAEEFFHEQVFAPRLVGNRFLHAIPTVLTTLGLLGTFAGLTIGLRGIELGSSGDELRSGIQVLVEGAALGFTASLWGVFMSLVVNVTERLLERGVVTRTRALQTTIDKFFQLRSPEQSLSDIATHTGESEKALQVLHEKIGSALQESVARVGAQTERAISDAITSTLAPVMENLAERAANQSADVFQAVSAQLTGTFEKMGLSLAEELSRSAGQMRATLDYMGEQLARQADQHLTQMTAMQEASVQQLADLRAATAEQMTMLQDALPRVITGLDSAASRIGSATEGFAGVAGALAGATDELRNTSTSLGTMLTSAVGSMDELASKTSAAAMTLTTQHQAVEQLLTTTLSASQSLTAVSESLRGGFTGMSAAQQAFLADLEKTLHRQSAEMAAWLAAYSDEVSKHTTRRMDEWNTQTSRFTSEMVSATKAMSDAIDEMGSRSQPAGVIQP